MQYVLHIYIYGRERERERERDVSFQVSVLGRLVSELGSVFARFVRTSAEKLFSRLARLTICLSIYLSIYQSICIDGLTDGLIDGGECTKMQASAS